MLLPDPYCYATTLTAMAATFYLLPLSPLSDLTGGVIDELHQAAESFH
jgi:hypothetical protein